MATDVIIDPSTGQIYWNDGTGSPESISIKGDAVNTISFTGYSGSFSPGSTPAGALTLVTIKDSAGTDALIPGTSGYNLGSSTLRWNTFATNANLSGTLVVSDSTISSSLITGSTRINGGIAISGNASIGQSLNFYNTAATFYTGFKAGSISANTLYTFPVAFPGTGTSVLQSDTSGTLTWVAMASGSGSGLATTATNVQVNIIGNPNSFHPLLMTPVQSSAGSAVSANGTLIYNPSTDILYTPGLAVTSGVDATNTTSGALQVRGGIGATGTSYFQTISVASLTGTGNAVINGNFTFNGVGVFGNATTDTINSLARYISDILPSADNSYDLGNNALGWRNFRVSGVGTVVTLSVTSPTVSTSTTTGALVVTGGVGIGGSLYTSIGSSSSVSGVTLANGNVSATTYNKLTLTAPATSATLTLANGSSLITSGGHSLTFTTTSTTNVTVPTTGTLATTSNKLSDFAATTSLELKNTISDETGSGALVFATSPDFATSVTTGSATFSVFNATATNVSAFGAATTLSIGAASGKATINSVDNSTSSTTGAFVVTGGAAVGQSLSIAGRLQMFNGATNYTAFLSSASTPVTYTLPPTAPAGVGSSYLSASTAGVMAWVAAPTSGGGSPGGSNKQIQYNNASAFGGAAGFEYITAGIANTVSIFSASGTGYTSGMWIHSINGSTTRVGIGLSNPQFELEILGEISATNKSFVIDHPTKSGMKLRYGSLEGPENGVYVRGELNNSNIIEVPDHWVGLVHEDSYTVHLTPMGSYAQLYVEKIENYNVFVADNMMGPIHCYYSVWAERKDIPKLVTEY
jgi:hypothetical protein